MKITCYAVYTYHNDLKREFHETAFDYVTVREGENIEERVFKCIPSAAFADSYRVVPMKTIEAQ